MNDISNEDNLISCLILKKDIDRYLTNNEYNKAFYLLVNVLNKLNSENIHNFIKCYDNSIIQKEFIRSKL